jgi:hypothetical protein
MGFTRCKSADGSPEGDSHVTTLAIVVIAAGCAEHLVFAYFNWTLANRKGRMWLPYAIFGVLGYVVLVLRAPASERSISEAQAAPRSGLTHTGFARPEEAMDEPALRRKRVAPLAGYHLPRGLAAQRNR